MVISAIWSILAGPDLDHISGIECTLIRAECVSSLNKRNNLVLEKGGLNDEIDYRIEISGTKGCLIFGVQCTVCQTQLVVDKSILYG